MKKNHKSFLGLKLIGLLLLIPFIQQAQDLEVGLFGGVNYYVGDINPAKQFSQPEPAYGLIARYNPNTRWTFRGSFTMGTLIGDDAVVKFNESRALAFETQVNDFSLIAEFNFFDYFTGSKRDYVTPYIFGGFSVFSFNFITINHISNPQPGAAEGVEYNQRSFSIPFGAGVKYSLGNRVGLAFEWRMHKTFTDYLDDVSNVDNEGMKRGDTSTNDWFSYAGITLTYKFDLIGNQRCDNFNQTNH